MKRNQKGSTLVWAITIIMVMMVLITAMLTISHQYYARSQQNFKIRQAQITAQSAGDSLSELIHSNRSGMMLTLVPEKFDGSADAVVQVKNIKLGDKMGTAQATITRTKEDRLTIQIKAEYAEIKADLTVKMQLKDSDKGGQAWIRVDYESGSEAIS